MPDAQAPYAMREQMIRDLLAAVLSALGEAPPSCPETRPAQRGCVRRWRPSGAGPVGEYRRLP